MQGSRVSTPFPFPVKIVLLETDYSSEAFKENINILLLLTGSFPPKPLKTTAHGLPKISRTLFSNGPTFGKKYKKRIPFFQALVLNKVKWAQKRQRLL